MTKALLSTLCAEVHGSLICCIAILPAINTRIQDLRIATIFICLQDHVFSYDIIRAEKRLPRQLAILKAYCTNLSIGYLFRCKRSRTFSSMSFSLSTQYFYFHLSFSGLNSTIFCSDEKLNICFAKKDCPLFGMGER